MKKIITTVIILISMLGCELESAMYDKTFINNSSYMITIEPNGQTWDGFLIESNGERTITIDTETCYFVYSYSNCVNVAKIDGDAVFTDK